MWLTRLDPLGLRNLLKNNQNDFLDFLSLMCDNQNIRKKNMKYNLTILETDEGEKPFIDWLDKLDVKIQARINNRLSRIKIGNFGDFKSVGDKVFKLRFFFGSGYRIYYGIIEEKIVLILSGGDKDNQSRDIEKAKKLWATYLE